MNKTIRQWLNDKTRRKGCTKHNVHYLREYKGADAELSRIAVITYFLKVRLGINDCNTMMRSARKQRDLLWVVICDLKVYRVEAEDVSAFEHDLRSIQRRCAHVFRIVVENVRLTEYYPFFREMGFDILLDFGRVFHDGEDSALDKLLPEIESWNAKHKEDIAQHMESVRREIEIRDAHRAMVEAKAKAEKEARKQAKREENAEIREMKKNAEKYRVQERKFERSINRYYK